MTGRSGSGPPAPAVAAIGLLAGFYAGLFGVGGGILVAPGLMLLGGMPPRKAHGTSLGATVFLAGAGVAAYALDGSVDVPAALLVFAGSSLGVLAGTLLLNRIPVRLLRVLFVLLLGVTAGRLLAGVPAGSAEITLSVAVAFALVGCGALAGLLAGLLGVGGGVIVVPALMLFFEVTPVVAKGTSLLVVVPTAVVGTLVNMRLGNVDVRGSLLVGVGGLVSAFGGALLAGVIAPALATGLFAGMMLVVAARMIAQIRRPGPDEPTGAGSDGSGGDDGSDAGAGAAHR